jgi:hypothetical protein
MKRIGVAVLLLAFAVSAEDPLTNDDVIKLVGAGLTQDTIETKIFNSATQFRTDADALIDLTREGVPDRVVRAMIARQAEMPRSSEPVVESMARTPTRYFDVAIHRTKTSRCNTGELKLDSAGAHGRGCRPTDFDLYWNEVSSVCYAYGARGVVEFRTPKRNWRISTTTPAEAKKIIQTVTQLRPSLRRNQGCP